MSTSHLGDRAIGFTVSSIDKLTPTGDSKTKSLPLLSGVRPTASAKRVLANAPGYALSPHRLGITMRANRKWQDARTQPPAKLTRN
jgi:hypothetical protein